MDNAPAVTVTQALPVEKIKSAAHQARTNFDPQSIRNLAETMKSEGLIQPINVRALADGTWELIAGERRLRAAKLLGWTEIEAKIYPALSDQDAAQKGLIENLQREDLNPIECAKGYQRLNEAPFNLTLEQIAQMAGLKDRSSISNTLTLLDLPEEVQDLFSRENITEGHFRYLNRITDKTQLAKMAKQAAQEGWSVKETEKRVKQLLGKEPSPGSSTRPPSPKKGEGSTPSPTSGEGRGEGAIDPLAGFWPSVTMNPAIAVPRTWGVSYGTHPMPLGKHTLAMPAWTFWMKLIQKDQLAGWFTAMGKALSEPSEPQALRPQGVAAPMPAAPAPASPAPEPEEEQMDPKIAAMIAEHVAKGRLE